MLRIGIIFAIITITLMVLAYNSSQNWKTMVFTTLCLAQMGHALAVRSDTRLTLHLDPRSNPYLWGAVILTTVLQFLLLYCPPLQHFFATSPLTWQELAICLGFSVLVFVWVELEKWLRQIF